MCQGGELHLQCGCGRFDSGPLHRTRSGAMRLTSASVAKWQGTRLQSADRGFDSRPMLGARWLGRWIGLGSSKPDGRVRFPDELRLDIAALFASVRGRDPSFRSSVRWFESSRRYRARVVQWPRTARFQCAGAGSIPAASTGSWKARSAWCRHRSRKPGGAQKRPGSTPAPSATAVWKMISRWRERRLLNGWICWLRFDSAVFRLNQP